MPLPVHVKPVHVKPVHVKPVHVKLGSRRSDTGEAFSGGFRMTDGDLRRVAERSRALLGIDLNESKRQMVYTRLSRRLRALRKISFAQYLDLLETPEGMGELEHFANALTTNLTAFFRERHHFDHFERELQKPVEDRTRRLRIWSAGCATGEEPWSIAMVLLANAEHLLGRDRRVLATDVDTQVLAAAERGDYSLDRLRPVPPRFRASAFLDSGAGTQTVTAALRNLVIFRSLNLIAPWPFKGRFDVIFCRNVLIYFPPELRARTIDRFADLLQPSGLLYLGHSETSSGAHPKLIAEGHTIYRRVPG